MHDLDLLADPEVQAFLTGARSLLDQHWSVEAVRSALDGEVLTADADLWRRLTELGWFEMGLDATTGSPLLALVGLGELAGAVLLPGQVTASAVAAAAMASVAGPEGFRSLAEAIGRGELRACLALEEDAGWHPDRTTVVAERTGETWCLHGAKVNVLDRPGADVVLVGAVVAAGEDGAASQVVLAAVDTVADGMKWTEARRWDGRPVADLVIDGVEVPVRRVVAGPAGWEHPAWMAWRLSTLLLSAELVGVAQHLLEVTTAYATERRQFGRPIGSFQAVSHRLAKTLVDVEMARSLVLGAAVATDDQDLLLAAKAKAAIVAVDASETALQLHGGIGYTWDLDVHLYLRRARADATTLGCAAEHLDRLGRSLLARSAPSPMPAGGTGA